MTNIHKDFLGFGLGLRKDHFQEIIDTRPKVDWFEILTENYLVPGGKPLYFLDQIAALYPMVMHGVSLSLGSADPLDFNYLAQLKQLAKRVNAYWISDHLCWTGVGGSNLHDLLPLPYTEEALNHVVERINRVQDFLGQRILIENVSSYITYSNSQMSEWQFISEVAARADCYILLDVNNIYVSAVNHNFVATDYIDGIVPHRVRQIHLAGHHNYGDYIIDTHDAPIIDPVWELYRYTTAKMGKIATMVERDDNIGPLAELLAELATARAIAEHARLECA